MGRSIAGRRRSTSKTQRHERKYVVSVSGSVSWLPLQSGLVSLFYSSVINTYLLNANYESGTVLGAEDTAIKKVALFIALEGQEET